MASFPDHNDRANVDALAKALGWSSATIAICGKGWRIFAVLPSGEQRSSHSKGVPASQLRAWIDGAQSMRILADKTRKELIAARSGGARLALANLTNEELTAEIHRREAANTFDIGETFGWAIRLTEEQLRERCEAEGVKLWNDDEACEAGVVAARETSSFIAATRLAFAMPSELTALQADLRHALTVEHNFFTPGTAHLI